MSSTSDPDGKDHRSSLRDWNGGKPGMPCVRAIICVLLAASLGCGGNEARVEKHMQRAEKYMAKGSLKEAEIELRNVIQLEPRNAQAWLELGEVYLEMKRGRDAFDALSRSISIEPYNLKAQVRIGQIYLRWNMEKEAREKADMVLEISPDDVDALLLLSGIQLKEGNTETALSTMQRAVALEPENFEVNLFSARLLSLCRLFEGAEKAYLKAIELNQRSSAPFLELAIIYCGQGRWEEAESVLGRMINHSENKSRDLLVLARFYESRQIQDRAEQCYLKAVEEAGEEEIEPLLSLGAYYERIRSYDKALAAMDKALSRTKDDPEVLTGIARLQLGSGRSKEAEDTIDRVLENDHEHPGANLLKGKLLLERKSFDEAIERFDLALGKRPDDYRSRYFKALSLSGKGDFPAARVELTRVLELSPGLVRAGLLLAEIYLREGKESDALVQTEAVLDKDPQNIEAWLLSGNIHISAGDRKAAEEAFQKVLEIAPDKPEAFVRLGYLRMLDNRIEEALEALKKAVDLDPLNEEALELIIDIYLRTNKPVEGFRLCKDLKAGFGNSGRHPALIDYLEAKIFLAGGRLDRAEECLERAVEKDPNLIKARMDLASIHLREEKIGDAVARYKRIVEDRPEHIPAHMALGAVYQKLGDLERAEESYRSVLRHHKEFAPAANNLAWIILCREGNMDEALYYARLAKERMPGNAGVMDTLGWVYYKKGSYLNAIDELKDALRLEPGDPVINYHMGLACYRNNQPDAAEGYLEKALSIDTDFEGAETALRIVQEIRSRSR